MDISGGTSILAIGIALFSLYRTRKQHELENKYNETSSKLAEFQLRILEREEAGKNSADIAAYFYKDFNSQYRIAVTNTGHTPAKNVQFTLNLPAGDTSPLIESDAKSKLPVKVLHPGEELYLLAAITLGMKPAFDAQLSWTNPDGKTVSKDFTLTMPG